MFRDITFVDSYISTDPCINPASLSFPIFFSIGFPTILPQNPYIYTQSLLLTAGTVP